MLSCYQGWSRGTGKVSNRIASITRPPGWSKDETPSHTFVFFSDGQLFEAHLRDGGWVRRSVEWYVHWLAEDPHRKIWHAHISSGEDACRILHRCEDRLGLWPYNKIQLGELWLRERLGLGWAVKASWKVVCSEAAAKVIYPTIDYCTMLDLPPYRFDAASPAGQMLALNHLVADGLPPGVVTDSVSSPS